MNKVNGFWDFLVITNKGKVRTYNLLINNVNKSNENVQDYEYNRNSAFNYG